MDLTPDSAAEALVKALLAEHAKEKQVLVAQRDELLGSVDAMSEAIVDASHERDRLAADRDRWQVIAEARREDQLAVASQLASGTVALRTALGAEREVVQCEIARLRHRVERMQAVVDAALIYSVMCEPFEGNLKLREACDAYDPEGGEVAPFNPTGVTESSPP